MLVGVSMLLLAAGAIVERYEATGASLGFAAGLTAVLFVFIGVFALLWGGAHVWAAMLLRRRQAAGRFVTLGLAVTTLLVLPFGTALGAYALWVLLANVCRRLFETAPAVATR